MRFLSTRLSPEHLYAQLCTLFTQESGLWALPWSLLALYCCLILCVLVHQIGNWFRLPDRAEAELRRNPAPIVWDEIVFFELGTVGGALEIWLTPTQ